MQYKINYTKTVGSIEIHITEEQLRYLYDLVDAEVDRTKQDSPGWLYSHLGEMIEKIDKAKTGE